MTGRHLWLGAGVLTAASILAFARSTDDGLSRPDGFDYAQIGRELVEGRGFSTRQAIYALHLRFLEDHALLQADWPNLHRFPLPSLVMAGWFLVLGVGFPAVVAYGIGFHVGTSVLLFQWARQAMGLAPATALVLLFSTSGPVLETGVSGLAEPAATFFFTLALFCLWRSRGDRGLGWTVGAGVALGLAVLSRTNSLLAVPVFMLASTPSAGADSVGAAPPWKEAIRRAGVLAVGVVVVTGPWMIRNWVVAGSPTFSLHSYFLLPSGTLPPEEGDKWDTTLPWVNDFEPPLAYARAHPDRLLEKWRRHGGRLLAYYPQLAGVRFLSVVALLGLVLPAGRGLRPVTHVLFGSFAANAVFVSLGDHFMPRYYHPYLPGMLLVGVGVIWSLIGRIGKTGARPIVLAAAVLVMVDPHGIRDAARFVDAGVGQVPAADMEFVEAHTAEDAVVLSDVSWAVAWETGRRSVRNHFARRPDGSEVLSVLRFNAEFLPIDAVYLRFLDRRTRVAHRNLRDDAEFRALFPNRRRLPSGGVFYSR